MVTGVQTCALPILSATFGNDVVAICTGKIDDQGVLRCSELVTKCPSKYENASEALDIARLLEYGEGVYDKPVKVAGIVKAGTLVSVGKGRASSVGIARVSGIRPGGSHAGRCGHASERAQRRRRGFG